MFNFPILALAALVPLVVGFIWYNPKVFGTSWMAAAKITPGGEQKNSMAMMLIVSYILSLFAAMALQSLVIHQMHVYSALMSDPGLNTAGSESNRIWSMFHDNGIYAHNFRTAKHGMLHGVLASLFLVMPVIATNALYEQKGFKYIAINAGYWMVSLGIMGAILSAYA